MTHEELEESVPLYAAGALDRIERQAMEAHLLSGCASCHSALKDYQSVAALLPLSLSPTRPPRSLKATIMAGRNLAPLPAETAPNEPARPSLEPGEWMNHLFPPVAPARSSSLPWALGLATLLIVSIGGYFAWSMSTQRSIDTSNIKQLEASIQEKSTMLADVQRVVANQAKALDELRNELQQRTNEAAEAKEQLAQREAELDETRVQLSQQGGARTVGAPQDELATLLRIPNVKAVSLTGSEMAKRAAGFLLYDSRTQKIWIYTVNLPESPAGTTYQLWAIHDKPISIGTFQMDTGDTAHLLVKKVLSFTDANTFAVSLEPSGGRPQPTGPMYLLSRS
ncbi:MAG TPA: anti-sigma factor [Nitrospiraceae bacterium]|jgi:anti-sigma-K factor RskA|nr:anti-sigma factor [Nitrospiraceae bacterium]